MVTDDNPKSRTLTVISIVILVIIALVISQGNPAAAIGLVVLAAIIAVVLMWLEVGVRE